MTLVLSLLLSLFTAGLPACPTQTQIRQSLTRCNAWRVTSIQHICIAAVEARVAGTDCRAR